jgi:hypothetical protein
MFTFQVGNLKHMRVGDERTECGKSRRRAVQRKRVASGGKGGLMYQDTSRKVVLIESSMRSTRKLVAEPAKCEQIWAEVIAVVKVEMKSETSETVREVALRVVRAERRWTATTKSA